MIVSTSYVSPTRAVLEVHDDLCRHSWGQMQEELRRYAREQLPDWAFGEVLEAHSNVTWGGARLLAVLTHSGTTDTL